MGLFKYTKNYAVAQFEGHSIKVEIFGEFYRLRATQHYRLMTSRSPEILVLQCRHRTRRK